MSDGMKHGIFRTPESAQRLRIYVGESDKHQGTPLYQAIVLKAREQHLAGATVLHGSMGFGANSRIHTAKILRLSEDLPIVVEIVDARDRVTAFLPHLETMVTAGLVTIEEVGVLIYSPSASVP